MVEWSEVLWSAGDMCDLDSNNANELNLFIRIDRQEEQNTDLCLALYRYAFKQLRQVYQPWADIGDVYRAIIFSIVATFKELNAVFTASCFQYGL